MRNSFLKAAATGVVALAAVAALITIQAPQAEAQGKGGKGKGPAPLQSPNPHYEVIEMEIDVNRPAEEVWARVGKYCDIGEWIGFNCTMLSGEDGEWGSVRSVGNEILVGKTELSYTYTQPVREGQFYDMYHGTLEARPVNSQTSKLVYTLVFDNSQLADDAAREADVERRRGTFERALANMKILAEGGELPAGGGRGKGKGK